MAGELGSLGRSEDGRTDTHEGPIRVVARSGDRGVVDMILARHAAAVREKVDSALLQHFERKRYLSLKTFFSQHTAYIAREFDITTYSLNRLALTLRDEGIIAVHERTIDEERVYQGFNRPTVYAISAFADLLPYRGRRDPMDWEGRILEARVFTALLLEGADSAIFEPQGAPRTIPIP